MLRILPLALMLTAAPALADTFAEVKVSAGKALFDTECRRCHAVDASDPSYGPLLTGIVGRQAASFEGYEYSEALAGSGIVWTPAALRAWMEDNDGFMPGTKMRHVGIEDPTVQTFILAYLGTLTEG
jgi:cytochrome c